MAVSMLRLYRLKACTRYVPKAPFVHYCPLPSTSTATNVHSPSSTDVHKSPLTSIAHCPLKHFTRGALAPQLVSVSSINNLSLTALVFHDDMFEPLILQIMVKQAGRRPESLHVTSYG